jgi:hypothetical protein
MKSKVNLDTKPFCVKCSDNVLMRSDNTLLRPKLHSLTRNDIRLSEIDSRMRELNRNGLICFREPNLLKSEAGLQLRIQSNYRRKGFWMGQDRNRKFPSIIAYRATLTLRFSRITVTFTWPG